MLLAVGRTIRAALASPLCMQPAPVRMRPAARPVDVLRLLASRSVNRTPGRKFASVRRRPTALPDDSDDSDDDIDFTSIEQTASIQQQARQQRVRRKAVDTAADESDADEFDVGDYMNSEENEDAASSDDDTDELNTRSVDALYEEVKSGEAQAAGKSEKVVREKMHPVQRAVLDGDIGRLRRLIDKSGAGALMMMTRDSFSLMHLAAFADQLAVAKLLHQLSTELLEPNGVLSFLHMTDANGWTPIHTAAVRGCADLVAAMLEWDESLRLRVDRFNRNVLHLACGGGHLALAERLYRRYPRLGDELDVWGFSPLFLAVESGSVELVKLLAGNDGARLRQRALDGTTPALFAAKMDMRYVLQYLLRTYPDLLADRDAGNQNLAHVACAEGNVKVVAYLWRLEPRLFYDKDANGLEPILVAKAHNKEETWRFLIRAGLNSSLGFPELVDKTSDMEEERLAIDEILDEFEKKQRDQAAAELPAAGQRPSPSKKV